MEKDIMYVVFRTNLDGSEYMLGVFHSHRNAMELVNEDERYIMRSVFVKD